MLDLRFLGLYRHSRQGCRHDHTKSQAKHNQPSNRAPGHRTSGEASHCRLLRLLSYDSAVSGPRLSVSAAPQSAANPWGPRHAAQALWPATHRGENGASDARPLINPLTPKTIGRVVSHCSPNECPLHHGHRAVERHRRRRRQEPLRMSRRATQPGWWLRERRE